MTETLVSRRQLLQAGGAILFASSALGFVATTFADYRWLAGPAVLGLFAGLCGITVLLLLHPELFYADTCGQASPAITKPGALAGRHWH